MQELKDIALEKIEIFQDVHFESIRNILNEDKVYLKHVKMKKYRKRFEADIIGQMIQDDVSTISNALRKLGITLINSKPYQPQGKGKVEKKIGVFQNQLPFYIKLNNAKNIDEANMVLEKYIIKHNSAVNRATKDTQENIFKKGPDIFKDISKKDLEDIENAFTIRATRKVSNINEITYSNKIYNVPKYKNISLATFKSEIRENSNKLLSYIIRVIL